MLVEKNNKVYIKVCNFYKEILIYKNKNNDYDVKAIGNKIEKIDKYNEINVANAYEKYFKNSNKN